MIAALYVATGGGYYGLPNVDPWDVARDARLYAGPHAVVAHPPCQRWSRLACVVEAKFPDRADRRRGEDSGCFAAALAAVRKWGGVLEHPESSAAWPAFGLNKPRAGIGWRPAGDGVGLTCSVEQGHYGHRARKATWLYLVGAPGPALSWGPSSPPGVRLPPQRRLFETTDQESARLRKIGFCGRMSGPARSVTPLPFRDVLLAMARSVAGPSARLEIDP